MKRIADTKQLLPKDRIIFPLDVPNLKEAQRFVRLLKDNVGVFKIGLELFVSEGPDIIRMVKKEGKAKIFLDMKFHDIPETVSRAYMSAKRHGIDFVTIHCENINLLKSVVKNNLEKTQVLAVTVLTSLSKKDLQEIGIKKELQDPLKLVLHRARLAKKAGLCGVVCSGLEVRHVKKACGMDFITVCPGIRPVWGNVKADDQKRFVTPSEAVKNGADYIVVGRPVRDASNPATAAEMIADEIRMALSL